MTTLLSTRAISYVAVFSLGVTVICAACAAIPSVVLMAALPLTTLTLDFSYFTAEYGLTVTLEPSWLTAVAVASSFDFVAGCHGGRTGHLLTVQRDVSRSIEHGIAGLRDKHCRRSEHHHGNAQEFRS